MALIADEVFSSLIWDSVDGEQLNELIKGWTICGAEPIDYPLIDGVIIYLMDGSGNLAAVELGQDPDAESFYMNYAKIPVWAALS